MGNGGIESVGDGRNKRCYRQSYRQIGRCAALGWRLLFQDVLQVPVAGCAMGRRRHGDVIIHSCGRTAGCWQNYPQSSEGTLLTHILFHSKQQRLTRVNLPNTNPCYLDFKCNVTFKCVTAATAIWDIVRTNGWWAAKRHEHRKKTKRACDCSGPVFCCWENIFSFLLLWCRVMGWSISSPWICFSGSTACTAHPAGPGANILMHTSHTHTKTNKWLCCRHPQGYPADILTIDHVTPLHEACLSGHVACVRALINAGANVSSGPFAPPLPIMSELGHVGCARLWCLHRWTPLPSTVSLLCTTAVPLAATAVWSCCFNTGHWCWRLWHTNTTPPPCTKPVGEVRKQSLSWLLTVQRWIANKGVKALYTVRRTTNRGLSQSKMGVCSATQTNPV